MGYSLTFGIALLIINYYLKNRMKFRDKTKRYVLQAIIISIAGGLFALFPDIEHLIDVNLHSTFLVNFFYFHGFLDSTTILNDIWVSAEMLIILLSLAFLAIAFVINYSSVELWPNIKSEIEEFRYIADMI